MTYKCKIAESERFIKRVNSVKYRMEQIQLPHDKEDRRLQNTYTSEEWAELNSCLDDFNKRMNGVIARLQDAHAHDMDIRAAAKRERDEKYDIKKAKENLVSHGVEDASLKNSG